MESIYYAVKVVALLWILMVVAIVLFGADRSVEHDRLSQVFIAITLSTVFPILGYAIRAGENAPGTFPWAFPAVSYIGFLIFVLGVLIHWIGILTLSKQWSAVVVIKKDHKLVESGIYRYIRHPIYAALLLELLGLGLALGNWIAILALLIPNAVSLAYRIYVEEDALKKHFGDAYIDYARKTRRLIPGVL